MNTPDALLLIAPGCPHCPAVLDTLSTLVKEGAVGALEVVNIATRAERAAALGVRSVPWCRIGEIELVGARTSAELRQAVEWASSLQGVATWLGRLLEEGGLGRVEAKIRRTPELLAPLAGLLGSAETPMQVRLGIGALFEGLESTEAAAAAVSPLVELAGHADPRVRADACHCLGYTGVPASPSVMEALRPRLEDEDAEVREIAAEALERLGPS